MATGMHSKRGFDTDIGLTFIRRLAFIQLLMQKLHNAFPKSYARLEAGFRL